MEYLLQNLKEVAGGNRFRSNTLKGRSLKLTSFSSVSGNIEIKNVEIKIAATNSVPAYLLHAHILSGFCFGFVSISELRCMTAALSLK